MTSRGNYSQANAVNTTQRVLMNDSRRRFKTNLFKSSEQQCGDGRGAEAKKARNNRVTDIDLETTANAANPR